MGWGLSFSTTQTYLTCLDPVVNTFELPGGNSFVTRTVYLSISSTPGTTTVIWRHSWSRHWGVESLLTKVDVPNLSVWRWWVCLSPNKKSILFSRSPIPDQVIEELQVIRDNWIVYRGFRGTWNCYTKRMSFLCVSDVNRHREEHIEVRSWVLLPRLGYTR